MWKSHFRTLLASKLEEAQARNPAFSLRSFAKKLGTSPGMLSEILKDRRKISINSAERIIAALELSPQERSRIEQLIAGKTNQRVLLKEEAYEFASRWYYPAIISLFDLDNPPSHVTDVAARLGMDDALAEQAVNKLLQFGFLQSDQGTLKSSRMHFTTTEDIPQKAFQQGLAEGLERAALALKQLPPDQREITSVTFDGSLSCLPASKAEIRKFRDQMVSVMQGVKRDSVFCLNIQLIPMTSNRGEST